MKKIALLSVLIMMISGSAWAIGFEQFDPAADCEGWSVSGQLEFFGAEMVDLIYVVRIYEGAMLLEEFSGTVRIFPSDPTFNLGDTWGEELCGDYDVTGLFELKWGDYLFDSENFAISFTCECPPELCTFTPGFWKNHPEHWPVAGLTIGGHYYPMEELLDIFDWPTRKHIERKLFHHLVAAMLNVLIGSAMGDIEDHIMDADDFFAAHPLGSDIGKFDELLSVRLKRPLVAYNEIECPDDDYWDNGLDISPDGISSFQLNTTVEQKSWGAIKSLYK